MPKEYTDADDAESLLSHSQNSTDEATRISRNSPRSRWRPSCALATALIGSHILAFIAGGGIAGWWEQKQRQVDMDEQCAKWTSHPSPVINDVPIKYSMVKYNGSFFHETIYRRDPSPAVDEAWKALGVDYRALKVPESEARAAGITEQHVKIAAQYGGGYPANVEGLHHLHCLNLLRQGLYYNYEYYQAVGDGAFKNEEPVVKSHITHCLDILRQQLMCTVDTGVLGQVWWNPESPAAFVDFNTQHKCKNYDAIRRWAEERQLPETPPTDYLEPPTSVLGEIP